MNINMLNVTKPKYLSFANSCWTNQLCQNTKRYTTAQGFIQTFQTSGKMTGQTLIEYSLLQQK